MRLRYYRGRYAQVKRYRPKKPRVRVYRYGVIGTKKAEELFAFHYLLTFGGEVVYTAKPKRRNAEFPGCLCFAVTLDEAQLHRKTFDPSARAFVQVSRGCGNAHTDC